MTYITEEHHQGTLLDFRGRGLENIYQDSIFVFFNYSDSLADFSFFEKVWRKIKRVWKMERCVYETQPTKELHLPQETFVQSQQ